MKELRVLAITDRRLVGGEAALVAEVEKLIAWGVRAVLLREKDLPARDLAQLADRMLAVTRPAGALLLVADRVDVGLAVGADGAHLARHSISVAQARRIAPSGFLIGASCHNEAELREAEAGGADYALLSPVFAPTSKAGVGELLGLEGFAALVGNARLPVLGLGGISAANGASVLAAGAHGLAGIGAFFPAKEEDVRRLLAL